MLILSKKKIILTLVKRVRKTFLQDFCIMYQDYPHGRPMGLNSEDVKDSLGFIAKEQTEGVNG